MEAFFRPIKSGGKDEEMHLLLGIPWLHDVKVIHIRDSRIELGDKTRGEQVYQIKGPECVESGCNGTRIGCFSEISK